MVKLLTVTFLILSYLVIFISTADYFYLNISELKVHSEKNVKWKIVHVDLIQPTGKLVALIYDYTILPLLRVRLNDFYPLTPINEFAVYIDPVKEEIFLRITFFTKYKRKRLYETQLWLDFGLTRNISQYPCKFVNRIYSERPNGFRILAEISLKMCFMRNVKSKKEVSDGIRRFRKTHENYTSNLCDRNLYKYAVQLHKMVCLCKLNEKECSSYSDCRNNDEICSNNGFCVRNNDNNRATCECLNGYGGEYCEKVIPHCKDDYDCLNEGKCVEFSDSKYCDCPPDTHGWRCEYFHSCIKYFCKNDGECLGYNDTFYCHCKPGFTGRYCDFHKAKCPHCKNGGVCINPKMDSEYICKCPEGFVGRTCQIVVKPCKTVKCLNHGHCYKIKNREVCYCQRKYYGEICDKTSDCDELCENGGYCIPSLRNIRDFELEESDCVCPLGFSGEFCDILKEDIKQKSIQLKAINGKEFFGNQVCCTLDNETLCNTSKGYFSSKSNSLKSCLINNFGKWSQHEKNCIGDKNNNLFFQFFFDIQNQR